MTSEIPGSPRARRARRPLAVLAFVLVLAAGAAVAVLRPTTYEARAQIAVTPVSRTAELAGLPVFRELGDPIRTIGESSVPVKLHRDVTANVTVKVVAQ